MKKQVQNEEKKIERLPSTRADGSPFDESTIEAVWQKGTQERNYPSFRRDVCGSSMQRTKYCRVEYWGWEIDHIKPVSKGGTDDIANLQPLQWENNRAKGDEYPEWRHKIRV